MSYVRTISVEFNHCDPAGIVFYPRYFEMINSTIENFFLEVVEYSFRRMMIEGFGVPAVRIETEFRAPSRLGDRLDFALEVLKQGNSSVSFAISARCMGELRLEAQMTLVWVGTNGRAASWPAAIRQALKSHEKGAYHAKPA